MANKRNIKTTTRCYKSKRCKFISWGEGSPVLRNGIGSQINYYCYFFAICLMIF